MAGEEEGETLHGSPQRPEDLQDLHEAAAAVTQVNAARPSACCFSGFTLVWLQFEPQTLRLAFCLWWHLVAFFT